MDQKLFNYGGIMKNTIANNSKSGKFFWWAHSAPIDVLTRKDTNPPNIIGTFHMLRDSTACLYLADQVRLLSRQKPSFDSAHLSPSDPARAGASLLGGGRRSCQHIQKRI